MNRRTAILGSVSLCAVMTLALPASTMAASLQPKPISIVGTAQVAAVAAASLSYPKGVGTAILTSAAIANLADAVSAAPLAETLKAPILLTTSPVAIGSATAAELVALHVHRVVLIGADDNSTLKAELPHAMTSVGYAGANRYQTAAAVFRAVEANGGDTQMVFYASGNDANLTDALTVDAVASAKKAPILLLPPTGQVPTAYTGLVKADQTSYVVGAAVSYHDRLPHVIPLAGVNRFVTATLVNQKFFAHPTGIVITNAAYLMDSLVASPLAGSQGMPIVMVGTTVIPGPSFDYLASVAPQVANIVTVGSPVAISQAMVQALVELTKMDGQT